MFRPALPSALDQLDTFRMDIHDDHPDLGRLAAEGRVVAYFGYGSLVNKHTLRTRFLAIRRASVVGWRRFWLLRAEGAPALLSVKPEEGHLTQGVVVYDHADHLPAVDEREAGYHRRVVMPGRCTIEAEPVSDVPLFIYEAAREEETASEVGAFILQSYIDAVLQGFHALYAEEGVRRFVAETDGFSTDLVGDRHRPAYPRSVHLADGEAALFDELLDARGVRRVSMPDVVTPYG